MKIFLDTSILSDADLLTLKTELVHMSDEFCVSALTHFEILLGYATVGKDSANYRNLLEGLKIDVVSLTREDSEKASRMGPSKKDFVDSLVAASAKRYGAAVWTKDSDFLKFLPRDSVRLLK